MNVTKLMTLMPMTIMVASLAYAIYSMQSVGSRVQPATSSLTEKPATGKAVQPSTAASLSKGAAPKPPATARDPFQVVIKPGSAETAKGLADQATGHTEIDPYPGMIQGLTLSGTFLQGRTEIAIISGQIYEKGQYLRGPGDEPSTLRVARVLTTGVILQAGSNQYMLSYPEGWAERSTKPRDLASAKPRQAKTPAARSPKAGTPAKVRPRSESGVARQALGP